MKKLNYTASVLLFVLCIFQAYAIPALAKDGYSAVAIDQAGDRVFAANKDTEGVDVIDAKTGALIASILSHADIKALALDGQRRLLAAGGENGVSIVSTDTLSVIATIPISGEPVALAVDSALGYLLIVTERGSLTIADLGSFAVIKELNLQDKPVSIAVDPTLHRAIVAHRNWGKSSDGKKSGEEKTRDNVSIIDLSILSVMATLPAGKEPVDVTVNPITHEAAVVNEKSNDVTLIDLVTLSVKWTVPVDKHPSAASYNRCLNTLTIVGGEDKAWLNVLDTTVPAVRASAGYQDRLYDVSVHAGLNKAVLAGKHGIQFYSLPNPEPHLNTLSPVSVNRGSGPIDLTVSGTGLTALTEIYLNGTRAESSFMICGELLVAIPETLFSLAGTIEVKAVNPAPQGGTSNILQLSVNNPAPSITALQPAQADAGSAGLTLTIVGSGFFPDTVFYLNSAPRTFTYSSMATIQTQLTAADLETGGYITIAAVNPQPGGGSSLTASFTVLNPIPSIISIDPTEITAGSADTTVVITGSDFVKNSSVLLNGQPVTTAYVSKTSVEATIASNLITTPGSLSLEVSNPAPGGGLSNAATIAVNPTGNMPDPLPEGTFGKQYEDLVPTDATIDAYDPKRFSIVTGLILNRTGNPVSDVKVSVHGRSEYGSARTDDTGRYSLPIDGGTTFTMVYEKPGLITSHRQVYVRWNDVAVTETVTMIAEDTKATTIAFNGDPAIMLIHRSTVITDSFGSRAMTMVFTGDNRAYVTDENGQETLVTSIMTRATEFDTPENMPAILPPTSAYTYCAELSVDGAKNVRFEKPVVTYVDNFLGFAVGEVVPVGYYDRAKGVWIASDNGVVVRLLDTNGDGIVDALDKTGDGVPDDLNGNGSFSDEVAGLSDRTIYKPNATFWRVSVTHFTPFDHNWPYGPPMDAVSPNPESDPDVDQQKGPDDIDCTNSYCERRSRVFHEDIPVLGTDMTLHYASNRVPGFKTVVTIPASGGTVPASLAGIIVRMKVAGRMFETKLPPVPNQKAVFIWDRLDSLQRPAIGSREADISIGFVYKRVYYSARNDIASAWARVGISPTGVQSREDIILWNNSSIILNDDGAYSADNGFGDGWTLSNHHNMYPWNPNVLIKGDGTRIDHSAKVIAAVAGNGQGGSSGDNGPATKAAIGSPTGVALDAAGNMYIADNANCEIRKVDSRGIITTVAGVGSCGYFNGDNIPAVEANLTVPFGILVDAAGNIFITEFYGNRIRKVDTSGIITTVAGNGLSGFSGDNGPAVEAKLNWPKNAALDAAGNIYIADTYNYRIRKVDTNGVITTVAGNGLSGFSGDNGPATNAKLYVPYSVAVDGMGNVFIADAMNNRIRKVNTSGIITTVAGNGSKGFSGDNGPAVQAGLNYPMSVAVDSEGNLLIADYYNYRIRQVDMSGIISTVTGNGSNAYSGDNGLANLAGLGSPACVAVDANRNIYIADNYYARVRKISLPGILAQYGTAGDFPFAEDNVKGFIMSAGGSHKYTIDLATGKNLLTFGYNGSKRLVSVTDRFGNRTTIQRSGQGTAQSITSPDGQITELFMDSNNHLKQVKYPDGSNYSFGYTTDGLMTDEYDQKAGHFIHNFDNVGRVINIVDPEQGQWDYSRTTDNTGKVIVTVKTGENNVTGYQDRTDLAGTYASIKTSPAGNVTSFSRSSNGLTETTSSCGMNTTDTFNLDPLYKHKFLSGITVKSPAGLSQTRSFTRAYQDADGDGTKDKFIETMKMNNKSWKKTNDTIGGSITISSPNSRNIVANYETTTLLTTQMSVSGLLPTTFAYDTRGRLTSMTTGSRTSTIAYDAFGYYNYIVTPDNRKFDYTYDQMGRLRSHTQPDGSVINYDYDLNGNLTVLTNAKQVSNTFDYTTVNQRMKWTTPLSGSYSYSFDKERKLKTVTFPSGRMISNTYSQGRLASTDTPEGTVYYSYNCGGWLSGAVRGSESIAFAYDGTLIKTDTRSGIVNQTISYGYNNDFNLTSIIYAGTSQTFGYDNDGLLITAGPFTIAWNAQNGLPESLSDGKLKVTRTFSGYGEMDANTYEVNNSQLYSWSLIRDDAGRITAKIDSMNGNGVIWEYGYDLQGQLQEVKQSGSVVESYEYDDNGNRTFETNTFRGTSNRAYSYSVEDHVLTAGQDTYQFDADGFLTRRINSAGTTTFTYSSRGELLSAVLTDGRMFTYDHDPMGMRIAKRVNGTIIEKYLWQGVTRLLAVYDGSNNLVMRFTYADGRMPVSMTKSGVTYYLFYDQIGSLRAVVDGNGQIVKELVYDSFGYLYNESNTAFTVPFGFAGGLHDKDTGLVRFGARDYDPTIGRWTAKDPIDFAGGDVNLFGYVGNSPINFIDPFGLELIIIGTRPGPNGLGVPIVLDTDTNQTSIGFPNTNNTDSSHALDVIASVLKAIEAIAELMENGILMIVPIPPKLPQQTACAINK